MFDVRGDFPVFDAHPGLAFLDSAASTQTPRQVIDAMATFDATSFANVHRGAYRLSQAATMAYEGARATVAAFVGAADASEIVFTRGTTSGLNLVAAGLADRLDDRTSIVVTGMEHHANLVPWQQVCRRTGATLRWLPLAADGTLDLTDLDRIVTPRTKILSFVHQSNVLGTVNPVDVLRSRARQVGALVFLDSCQAVPHRRVDVRALDVDAVAFSGHKMLGPTGIGALWARRELLEAMPPFITGGSMIEDVTMEASTFAAPPLRFEAGTPAIGPAVGLGAAADYLSRLGMDAVEAHVAHLTALAIEGLLALPGVRILGPAGERGPVVAFEVDGIHPHDVAQVLDAEGVAVRSGHHCALPLHRALGVQSSTRASFAVYNDATDVTALVEAVRVAQRFFGVS